MQLLLPPSEGKTLPEHGPVLNLDHLSFPELNKARKTVLDALIEVSTRDDAAKILKVGAKGAQEIVAQRDMFSMPCAPAREVYTGVLYDAAQLHEGDDVLIFSGLFGVTRGEDPIPAYRLSMNVSLPGIGPLKSFWRKRLAGADPGKDLAQDSEPSDYSENTGATENTTAYQSSANVGGDKDVTVDLRSELYRVTKPNPSNKNVEWWDVRIADSRNRTISHMAKHYRGLLARALLDLPGQPIDKVARTLGALTVENEGNIHHLTLVPAGL